MCNLYSLTKGQAADPRLVPRERCATARATCHRCRGSSPTIWRRSSATGPDGERELVMARWGMPGPPQFGGAPITNIRNNKSPHWRGWLSSGAMRCALDLVLRICADHAAQDADLVCALGRAAARLLRRHLDEMARRQGHEEGPDRG